MEEGGRGGVRGIGSKAHAERVGDEHLVPVRGPNGHSHHIGPGPVLEVHVTVHLSCVQGTGEHNVTCLVLPPCPGPDLIRSPRVLCDHTVDHTQVCGQAIRVRCGVPLEVPDIGRALLHRHVAQVVVPVQQVKCLLDAHHARLKPGQVQLVRFGLVRVVMGDVEVVSVLVICGGYVHPVPRVVDLSRPVDELLQVPSGLLFPIALVPREGGCVGDTVGPDDGPEAQADGVGDLVHHASVALPGLLGLLEGVGDVPATHDVSEEGQTEGIRPGHVIEYHVMDRVSRVQGPPHHQRPLLLYHVIAGLGVDLAQTHLRQVVQDVAGHHVPVLPGFMGHRVDRSVALVWVVVVLVEDHVLPLDYPLGSVPGIHVGVLHVHRT